MNTDPMPPESDCKYWAFISYSHQDKSWGDWLHKAIETFKVPSRIAGRASRDGKVPARLFPVFRDREELPTSGSLSANIEEALRVSRYLVVICSSHSATSRWVDEEIRIFKAMGREERILCLIVDGEPNATDKPDCGQPECFPPSVRYKAGPGGKLTEERSEPIAADARRGKDGKENAYLKVVAGLLGVGFDEIRQRDLERRRRQLHAKKAALEKQNRELSRNLSDALAFRADVALEKNNVLEAMLFLAGARERAWTPRIQAAVLALPAPIALFKGNLSGHKDVVMSVSFSPDGRTLASGSLDHTIKFWDAAGGQELRALSGHRDSVNSIAFTPDGLILASGSSDKTVKLWDAAEGKELFTLSGHNDIVRSVCFSPDGRLLASGSEDRTIKLWDVTNGKELAALTGHQHIVWSVAFSPDGRLLASGSEDRTIKLWDTAVGKELLTIPGHAGFVDSVVFSPDGKILASGSRDKSIILWDAATGQKLRKISGHLLPVNCVAFSPDGRTIASASEDNTIKLWGGNLPETMSATEIITDLTLDGFNAEPRPTGL